MTIQYLNTDLDLKCPQNLAPLVTAFKTLWASCQGQNSYVGVDGNWHIVFETAKQYPDPDSNIAAMLSEIESLSDPAKALWKACSLREFNIGYDCGTEPWAFNNGITVETLKRMVAVDAALRITIYPPEKK